MRLFIVSVFVAVASARPSGAPAPLLPVAAPLAIAAPVSTQYHSQDELGQYSYGYSNALSAKTEARAANGLTVGGYTYVDPEGKLQSVEYSSDANGFRVAASNLPVPPAVPVVAPLPAPLPVQDTPEVIEARTKHLEALEVAKVRSAEIIASAPAISTVVQQIPSLVAAAPATFIAASPLVSAAPLAAAKLAPLPEDAAQPQASTEASSEAPITLAPAESSTPASEVQPATLPASTTLLPNPAIGLRSIVTPTLPVGVAPIIPVPTTYSLHPFGFSQIITQPGATAYTAQFITAPVGAVAIERNEKAAKTGQGSE